MIAARTTPGARNTVAPDRACIEPLPCPEHPGECLCSRPQPTKLGGTDPVDVESIEAAPNTFDRYPPSSRLSAFG
jgi:hypothetical protein